MDPLIGRSFRSGTLRLEKALGGGGMGCVYKALDTRLQRPVAVKLLRADQQSDEAKLYFEREARSASKLWHPNIIQILDFGQEEDGTYYLVMEYVPGKSLADIIEEDFPLSTKRIVHIISQLLGALEEAHNSGIVHRDLKPENIMLQAVPGNPDFVKVLDFGIAKALDQHTAGPITQRGLLMGTPHFMAPEQILGHDVDPRSDLYAVGAILYQILTTHLPFEGNQVMHVLARVVSEQPMLPSLRCPDLSISVALEALTMRALRKNMESRYQNAAEFRGLILEVLNEKSAQSSPSNKSLTRENTLERIHRKDLTSIEAYSQSILSESIFDLAQSQINSKECEVTYLLGVLDLTLHETKNGPELSTGSAEFQTALSTLKRAILRKGGALFMIDSRHLRAFFGYPRPLEDSIACMLLATQECIHTTASSRCPFRVRAGLAYGQITVENDDIDLAHGEACERAEIMNHSALIGEILADVSLKEASTNVKLKQTAVKYHYTPVFEHQFSNPPASQRSLKIPLLEREKESRIIEVFLNDSQKKHSSTLTISGCKGIGKSRLLTYAARLASSLRMAVIKTSAERLDHVIPALTLSRIAHAVLELVPASNTAKALETLRIIDLHKKAILGLIRGTPPMVSRKHWPSVLSAAITAMLRTLAASQPLLIACDNIESLDPISRRVFFEMIPRMGMSPIAFLFAGSVEDTPENSPHKHGKLLQLSLLSDKVVFERLQTEVPVDDIQIIKQLVKQVEGLPCKLSWITENLQTISFDNIPEHFEKFPEFALSLRLRKLPKAARKLAAYAAAIGVAFPAKILDGSVPSNWNLRESLKTIGDAGLLTMREEHDGIWLEFSPSNLASTALQLLPNATLTQIHRLIARFYQKTRSKQSLPDHDYQWARHLRSAGYGKDSVKMFALASDKAARFYGPSLAARIQQPLLATLKEAYSTSSLPFQRLCLKATGLHLEAEDPLSALSTLSILSGEFTTDPAIKVERDLLQGRALAASSNRRKARKIFNHALKAAPDDQPLLRAHIHLQKALLFQSESRTFDTLKESREAVADFLKHEESLPPQHLELSWQPHLIIAKIHQSRQQHAKALRSLKTAAEGANNYKNPGAQARVSLSLANSLRVLDSPKESQLHYEKAIKLSLRCGDLRTHAQALHELAILEIDLNEADTANKHLQESLQLSCDIGWEQGVRLNQLWIKRTQT